MPAYPQNSYVTFGPGRMTPAVKALLWANIGMFVLTTFVPSLRFVLGLQPAAVVEGLAVWQPLTYMFLHDGIAHILFNMLALWMFGVELERLWGTPFFVRYYLVTGLGAAALTLVLALMPWGIGTFMYGSVTIGASGAIYGLLLAYGLYYPDRPIYLYMIVPIKAKHFVLIMGAISLLFSVSGAEGGMAHAAHLGGLVVGYAYLQTRSRRPLIDVKYYLARWRMNRTRRKFELLQGRKPGQGPPPGGWVH